MKFTEEKYKKPCSHFRPISGQWVPVPSSHAEEHDDVPDMVWEPPHSLPTTKDIDLHRYQCTQCGEVMYYSAWAREHYEGRD